MTSWDQSRHFPNPFPDYSRDILILQPDGQLLENFRQMIGSTIKKIERESSKNFEHGADDISVYTGKTGIALMYYAEYLRNLSDISLQAAEVIVKNAFLTGPFENKVSFVLGDVGLYALGAAIYEKWGNKKKRDQCLHSIVLMKPALKGSRVPDEVLYGRSGFLYGLLFVMQQVPEQDIVTEDLIKFTIQRILESGTKTAASLRLTHPPLKYYWHESEYLGAAHGYAGILHTLLLARQYLTEEELTTLIKPTIDFVLTLRYSSGNFLSSNTSSTDRLVQWCHGAPAVIHLFALAYQVFDDQNYLNAALECGDIIWQRGLLKKGYGLCHGVSGNAYAFLRLYQLTNDEKHLYRALKFAEWISDYGKHGCRIPDRPYSLFEGFAGVIYFLQDLLIPAKSAFPAYELANY